MLTIIGVKTALGLHLAIACVAQSIALPPRDQPLAASLTGSKFHQQLEQQTSGSWTNVELRSLLNKLASERRVAILLDRRIDPTVKMQVDIVDQPLREGLHEIARMVHADVSVTENLVYFGPPSATGRLRTLIELRTAELREASNEIPEQRRTQLTRRQTISWADLDTPSDILRPIAELYKLTIPQQDQVPHDLWAGNELPNSTAAEALSLILIQFDLTFSWIDGGHAIELVPIPEKVQLERRQRIRGRSADETLKLIGARFPQLESTVDGSDLIVRGTLEDHENVAALLNPSSTRKPTPQAPAPLQQRTFTLTIRRAPVRAVMDELKKSKVVFVYDEKALAAAGVNLDQPVDLDLNKATADEFLNALFSPLDLKFEIENLTVRLTPKKN